jgi:fructose-1,6-bisphosphatase/inositol monophosphatase family enzyme
MNEYLDFARKLALDAGEVMLAHFESNFEHREKDDKSIVTVADEYINHMVIDEVGKSFPAHSVLGEEASNSKDSEYAWVCDPIDGTVPFAKGLPVAVFSLALVRDGVPIVGVIYDPFMKRLYSAGKEEGAFLNDKPMQVSSVGLTRHSIVNIDWWPGAEFEIDSIGHELSEETGTTIWCLGSIADAACYVANGKYEACVFAGTKGKNIDVAAVKIIVEEAGGKVSDLFGNEQRYDKDILGAIISNGTVHDELVRRFSRTV